ncbi:hypothetical protein K4K48_000921 [Colletotrichum sp. SAR 10_66]|nr:hypothetical protein K4K48_000921 [Colletotrichum sp. SAR 10_66]
MSDSAHHSPDQFDEYAAELAGQSRDRVMRPAIEQMVRKFLHAIQEDGRAAGTILDFFGDNPTVIYGLKEPGWIWTGREEMEQCFGGSGKREFRIVPKIIVVDRSRVTCHVVNFEFDAGDFDSFKEIQRIIVFDLDKNNRIERLEYRDVAGTTQKRKGGRKVLEALAAEIEKGAVAVDYLS